MVRRASLCRVLALVVLLGASVPERLHAQAHAEPNWVEHKVRPGERLAEIAEHYATDEAAIREANALTGSGLRAGTVLRIAAREVPKRIEYRVCFGDNWTSIAERHGVTRAQLRRWNPELPRTFEAGSLLQIWVASDHVPTPPTGGLGVERGDSPIELPEVRAGAVSAGQPDRGRLIDGVQLPAHPALYWVRRPEVAYGTTHALSQLQLALARFRRDSGYRLPIVVSDISQRGGGAYGSHDSHQSGRDVDLWLPLRADVLGDRELAPEAGPPAGFDYALLNADRPSDIDWTAAWALVKALIRTGEVQYIFLSHPRQRELYRVARAEGMSVQALGELLQYPRRAQTAIVRHAPNHTRHLHVRFRCASHEARCR